MRAPAPHWLLHAVISVLLSNTHASVLGASRISNVAGSILQRLGLRHHPRHKDPIAGLAKTSGDPAFNNEEAIHIVYILCWNHRQDELMASIKSLHLFAEAALHNEPPAYYHIHLIANDITGPEEVSSLKPYQNFRLTLHGLHANVPEMFAACAMQDLYIHEREDFRHIDQILYVDIDTLFLDDPRGWWEEFEDMNARGALFGAAAEGGTWYSSNAPEEVIPYYGQDSGKTGLNSGSLMLHLDRLRQSNFSAERDAYVEEYGRRRDQIRLGPQDVLNIYGHYHPDHIFVLSCNFNFRLNSGCSSDSGIPVVLHGNGHLKDKIHIEHSKQNTYRHIYNYMSSLQF